MSDRNAQSPPPDGIVFRAMTAADINAAIALWNRTEMMGLGPGDEPASIARYLARNPGISQVAEVSGAVIATLMGGHDGRRGWLYHLAVDAAWRRKGIAGNMVQRAQEAFAQAGIGRLYLMIYNENSAGQAFWKAHGWTLKENEVCVMTIDIRPK